jgi:hypothetical protein
MRPTEQLQPSTFFALFLEFQRAHIPIEQVGKNYFNHDEKTAKDNARRNKYPFAVFKVGTQWMVDINELAGYLEKLKENAKKEHSLTHRIAPQSNLVKPTH